MDRHPRSVGVMAMLVLVCAHASANLNDHM
jgi:hypothetical protein